MDPPSRLPVWLFEFRKLNENCDAIQESLSADERRRAARFHFAVDRDRWIWWRHCLRSTLGGILEAEPGGLVFDYGPRGKPRLKDFPDIQFNLSHSGNCAALVVGREGEVGIDLELPDRDVAVMEIAQSYFCPGECDILSAAGERQRELFFRLWTAKEAIMKVTGLGMTLDPREIEIAMDPAGIPVGCRRAKGFPDAAERWGLHSATSPAGGILCVAAARCVPALDLMAAPPSAIPTCI